MKFKEHCAECEQKLGKSWDVVHRWLDAFAWHGNAFNPDHRIHRHHLAGIAQVRVKWGDEAAKAAAMHILADEGCIPEDEDYYRARMHENNPWL